MKTLNESRDELVIVNPSASYRLGGIALMVGGLIPLVLAIKALVGPAVGREMFLITVGLAVAIGLIFGGIRLFLKVQDKTLTFDGRRRMMSYALGSESKEYALADIEKAYVKVTVGDSQGPSKYELRLLLSCDPSFIDLSHGGSPRTMREYMLLAEKINTFLTNHSSVAA